ncbi:hypothetical protein AVEN_109715-1 [Araneus ventricosus]|uniref:Mariner Mos1 transposase n=1 Tax=Araneus ventricosus TaxID=182803 RepID=A0A4Y2LT76_ARAVE|nr:hypothetical protein AVEN_109715-1 [Araneus ventricosus]
MCTVFWDRQGILLVEFLPRGEAINVVRYCEILRKLRCAIQNKRRRMLSQGIVMLHDNSRPPFCWCHSKPYSTIRLGAVRSPVVQPRPRTFRLPLVLELEA